MKENKFKEAINFRKQSESAGQTEAFLRQRYSEAMDTVCEKAGTIIDEQMRTIQHAIRIINSLKQEGSGGEHGIDCWCHERANPMCEMDGYYWGGESHKIKCLDIQTFIRENE